MKRVTLAENVFEPATWTTHETQDVCAFLKNHFGDKFPPTARIYHKEVAAGFDVTPSDEDGIEKLQKLHGDFYVVVYPNDPVTIVIAAIAVFAIAVSAFLLMPSVPTLPTNQGSGSSNNSLGDRQNQVRLNGRIPDIFGTIRATPDLVQVPYKIFNSNSVELELSYMCISRGELEVLAANVFDGDTPVSHIDGESIEIYAPFTSPNSGDAPQLRIGAAIATPVVSVQKSSGINGDTLQSPNFKRLGTECPDIYFTVAVDGTGDGIVNLEGSTVYNFTKYFQVGDGIQITTGTYVDGAFHANLTGTYFIGTTGVSNPVQDKTMRLLHCAATTTDWNNLTSFTSGRTVSGSGPILDAYLVDTITGLSTTKWVGPVILNDPNLTGLLANIVAQQGLFKTNGTQSFPFPVTVQFGVTPVDESGIATGGEVLTSFTLPGSGVDKTQKALSCVIPIAGRVSVRARRTTLTDFIYTGSISDAIQWRDLYGTSPVTLNDFGNVTTVQALTRVTPASLGVKARKINIICTRKVPARIGGSTFGATHATNRADDIMAAICLDPYLGNRPASQVNFDSLYDTIAAVQAYFGIVNAISFNYGFDENDISFEETIAAISAVVFCQAYRRGNKINWLFEQQTEDSTLLFNHRNKLPRSETRTYTFGNTSDYDGVTYDYIDPLYETTQTIFLPNKDVINPQNVKSIGVRSKLQAYFQASRLWNKIQNRHVNVKFTATQQADMLVQTQRILIADNTRPETQDGYVKAQNVLELTLSQKAVFQDGQTYIISLQHIDGTIENIAITAGTAANKVVLGTAPRLPLALDPTLYARCTYEIVGSNAHGQRAFIVTEKTPQDNFSTEVIAVNYDARYYQNDKDYINGAIDANGTLLNTILRDVDGTAIKDTFGNDVTIV